MNEHFIGQYLTFRERLSKELMVLVIFTMLLLSFIAFNSHSTELWVLIVSLLILTALIYFAAVKAKLYVYEVLVDENTLSVLGESYNQKWQRDYSILDVEPKFSLAGSRFNIQYVLTLKCAEDSFRLNEYYNWDYIKLIQLFNEIKRVKNEDITLDEKIILVAINENT